MRLPPFFIVEFFTPRQRAAAGTTELPVEQLGQMPTTIAARRLGAHGGFHWVAVHKGWKCITTHVRFPILYQPPLPPTK